MELIGVSVVMFIVIHFGKIISLNFPLGLAELRNLQHMLYKVFLDLITGCPNFVCPVVQSDEPMLQLICPKSLHE